jgi:hypothetical protein
MDTVTRYSRWLATLDSHERSTVLDIKEPEKRIERIKELMQKQEERRFLLFAGSLPAEDRTTIFDWLREFVAAHADEIYRKTPPFIRQRIDEAPDEAARREQLFIHWQRARRDSDMPFPRSEDYAELFKKFSAETQKTIEASAASKLSNEPADQRTPERQRALEQERVSELVRMARVARYFPQISLEELLKYYAAMKPDDLRRKQLEGKEGEELRRELQRMYNLDHEFGRGGAPGPLGGRGFGPGGGWPGPPGGPRGDGRGRPGDRFDDKDRGGKPPPPPGERRPPDNGKPAEAK